MAPSLAVYDALGRCVLSQALSVGRQASIATLDLRSLPAGVYLAKLTAGSQTTTRKFVIQQ